MRWDRTMTVRATGALMAGALVVGALGAPAMAAPKPSKEACSADEYACLSADRRKATA